MTEADWIEFPPGAIHVIELLDRAERACEEAKELAAVGANQNQRSMDLIARSHELLIATDRLIGNSRRITSAFRARGDHAPE
jgi:hypothetical protein